MPTWFSFSTFSEGIYYFGILAFLAVVIPLWFRLRAWRLSGIDPPTPEELEEIERLGRTGSFRFSGRSSAVARHFERAGKTDADRNYGGTRNLHEATVVDSWRDDRGAD